MKFYTVIALTIIMIAVMPAIACSSQPKGRPVADAGGPYSIDEIHNGIEQDRQIPLDGRNSKALHGFIRQYSWSVINDPTSECFLTDVTSATPIFHAPNNVYSVTLVAITLVVTDESGMTNTDTTIVTVNPYDEAPVIIAVSPNDNYASINEPDDLTFQIDALDEEDSHLNYFWNNDATATGPTWTYHGSWDSDHVSDTINISVNVRDSAGNSDYMSWLLTVNDVNRAPTVSGDGPYSVDEDHGVEQMAIQLNAAASDPEGDSLSYRWTVINDVSHSSLSDANTPTPTFHAPAEVNSITYVTLEVEVTDNYAAKGLSTVVVAVQPYEEPAHKYMPTLKFEDGANAIYFPVDCAFDGDFNSSNNEAHYNEIRNNPAQPLWVYIHEVQFEGLTYLEYWYYYVYNNYFNTHYNDWECMIVVLDNHENPVEVIYGSHGNMRACSPSEVEWDGTHPIAYVEEGSHAMDVDPGTFPGGNPFHTWEGVGYIADWYQFNSKHTFFGQWQGDSGAMSMMEAGGYTYRGYTIQEANDGWWPSEYGVTTPWSEKPIWYTPTLDSY
jgi:hypothetical protein